MQSISVHIVLISEASIDVNMRSPRPMSDTDMDLLQGQEQSMTPIHNSSDSDSELQWEDGNSISTETSQASKVYI